MGAIIKSIAIVMNRSGKSYMETGAEAVRNCLKGEPMGPDGLDMLINTGIYPDNHLQEPAFASLLQGNQPVAIHGLMEKTFSFDLQSGEGVVMALSVLNGFLESGKIERGMVVAGDVEPIQGQSNQFNYVGHSGAVLVEKGGRNEGFSGFHQDIYPQFIKDYHSYSNYVDNELKLIINQSDRYLDHCIQCAEESIENFLRKMGVDSKAIDLFISSQSPVGFSKHLAYQYGKHRLNLLHEEKEFYSAGLIMALKRARLDQENCETGQVMFVSVGPGITVNLALYQNPA